MIDSLYKPSDWIQERFDIGRTVDVANDPTATETPPDDISGHGTKVATILLSSCPDAKYNFYRIESVDSRIRDRDVLKAFKMASEEDNVDVINYSVGADHINSNNEDCTPANQPCSLSTAAEEAMNEGTTVIAAAGNRPTFDSICCPALSNTTISVGGSISECRGHELSRPSSPTVARTKPKHGYSDPSAEKPPGAIWIENMDNAGIEYPLCSTEGCSMEQTCHGNQYNVRWIGNVEETPDNPNTYAPANFIAQTGSAVVSGTSYSTPIVSGGIANIINKCRDDGRELSYDEIKSAVETTGNELDSNDGTIFSMKQVYESLTGELLDDVPSGIV